jgi:hypothetical protein
MPADLIAAAAFVLFIVAFVGIPAVVLVRKYPA